MEITGMKNEHFGAVLWRASCDSLQCELDDTERETRITIVSGDDDLGLQTHALPRFVFLAAFFVYRTYVRTCAFRE